MNYFLPVSPFHFSQAMEARWTADLKNKASPALKKLWMHMAREFGAHILRHDDPEQRTKWVVLDPPTGSGKTQGIMTYCSMMANVPADQQPGVLIVTRLAQDADSIAAEINKQSNKTDYAVSHHSEKPLTLETLKDYAVVYLYASFLFPECLLRQPMNTIDADLPGSFRAQLRQMGLLQCTKSPPSEVCAVLNAYFARHPQTRFRVYPAPNGGPTDYAFVDQFPALKDVWIEANAGDLIDLVRLAALPAGLQRLGIDTLAIDSDPKLDRPKQNLEALQRFRLLEELIICGRLKDLGFLGFFPELKKLELWRNTLKSLAGLENAASITNLTLDSTGAKDLSPISYLSNLAYLDLHRLRNLDSLEPITRLKNLKQLRVTSCTLRDEMPALDKLTSLRVLVLDKIATVENLSKIAAAPSLRCLILSRAPSFQTVDALKPLAGHPTLQEIRIDSHDEAVTAPIRQAYGWKVQYANFPADEYLEA